MTPKPRSFSWPEAAATLLGAMWLALFPLWQGGTFSSITRAKWTGALILTAVTAAVILTLMLLTLFRRDKRFLRLSPCQLLALGYFLWVALSAWQGELAGATNSKGESLVWMGAVRYEGLHMQLCYAAVFLLMSFFPPRLPWVLRAAAVSLVAFFTIVMLQYAGLNPLNLFPGGLSIRSHYEFQGTIGNIDMVSGYLCLVTPLLLGGFVLLEKPDPLLLFAGTLGVMLELLMEVQGGLLTMALLMALMLLLFLRRPGCRSRILTVLGAAFVCAGVRSLVGLPWLDKTAEVTFLHQPSTPKLLLLVLGAACTGLSPLLKKRPGKALSAKAVAGLAAGVILLALMLILLLPLPQGSTLWELQQLLRGSADPSFGNYRLGVWAYTLDMAGDNLLFGTGPDSFLFALSAYLRQNGLSLPETFDNPHNEYLAILSNNGLPALLLYLGLMAVLVLRCFKSRSEEALVPALSVLCFLFQGLFSFSICLVSPMFWAVCGIACSMGGKKLAQS